MLTGPETVPGSDPPRSSWQHPHRPPRRWQVWNLCEGQSVHAAYVAYGALTCQSTIFCVACQYLTWSVLVLSRCTTIVLTTRFSIGSGSRAAPHSLQPGTCVHPERHAFPRKPQRRWVDPHVSLSFLSIHPLRQRSVAAAWFEKTFRPVGLILCSRDQIARDLVAGPSVRAFVSSQFTRSRGRTTPESDSSSVPSVSYLTLGDAMQCFKERGRSMESRIRF